MTINQNVELDLEAASPCVWNEKLQLREHYMKKVDNVWTCQTPGCVITRDSAGTTIPSLKAV